MNELEEEYYNEYDPTKRTSTIGAIQVSVPNAIAQSVSALFEAYKQADETDVYISPFFMSIPFTPLEKNNFETFAASYRQKERILKTSQEILLVAHAQGLRPLTFFELLATVTQYPEYQHGDKKLVTLTPLPDTEGAMRVPCFEPGIKMRHVYAQFFSSTWDDSYRFFFTQCYCQECASKWPH
jgi:hypothetical protein